MVYLDSLTNADLWNLVYSFSMKIQARLIAFTVAFCSCTPQGVAEEAPTLKQITAEQDWIAQSPVNPQWLLDGDRIMFSTRREGRVGRDFRDRFLLDIRGVGNSEVEEASLITPEQPGPYLTNPSDWNEESSACLVTNSGDVYLYTVDAGTTTQLTQTSASESRVQFLSDNRRYAFMRSGEWYIRSLNNGFEYQAADIRFDDAPEGEDEPDRDFLETQQRELFEFVRLDDEREEIRESDQKAWRDTNPNSVSGPFYLGDDRRSSGSWLSPSGQHVLVVTSPSDRSSDPTDIMPNYVTEDGYVETSTVRSKVGNSTETPNELVLLDLENERVIELPLDELPMIHDDPLDWLKAEREAEAKASQEDSDDDETESDAAAAEIDADENEEADEPATRPVSHMVTRWNDAGTHAAVMLISHDNKDRWIALVDTTADEPGLITAHNLRDEAWIGWGFNSFGFIPGTTTLWYISEESGYGHLYSRADDGTVTQHTSGAYEVRSLYFARDGQHVYMRTNRSHPGIQEIERLNLANNEHESLTDLGGTVGTFRVSPDESHIAFLYSNINEPPELYVLDATASGTPFRVTNTITEEFLSHEFQEPEIVAIPSSHVELPIYTRVYQPDSEKFKGPRPLVLFVHGAGYTQHANYEWSYYSREHMYHSLLTDLGFVVVAPDFRASSGYGRDWRTAIYRVMGYPELEDFQDTIDYAAEHYQADPERVGIYGGSYGGFMTLMAMFLEPDTYKAGAALRSVTDWAHYNHGYTSNILNTPEIDPDSYAGSSPINHAVGLEGRLLMLHGLLDNNVVAQDIIRLSQRLIELEKENWELALAPIEPHGYQEPSSWLDQMRRIHKLFMEELADE